MTKKTELHFYVCPDWNDPAEPCDFTTYWSANDYADRGNPVCANGDSDMVRGHDICKQPQDDDGRCGCTNKDAHGV